MCLTTLRPLHLSAKEEKSTLKTSSNNKLIYFRVAVKMKQENMSIKRPEVSKMKELAQEVNCIPLPHIPDTKQILLPPQEHALIRNNFQIYTEDLLKQLNVNSIINDNMIEKADKISERASLLNDASEDQSKAKLMKRDDEIFRPAQTVLRRKKNREVKISLDLGRDRKKEISKDEGLDHVINSKI